MILNLFCMWLGVFRASKIRYDLRQDSCKLNYRGNSPSLKSEKSFNHVRYVRRHHQPMSLRSLGQQDRLGNGITNFEPWAPWIPVVHLIICDCPETAWEKYVFAIVCLRSLTPDQENAWENGVALKWSDRDGQVRQVLSHDHDSWIGGHVAKNDCWRTRICFKSHSLVDSVHSHFHC